MNPAGHASDPAQLAVYFSHLAWNDLSPFDKKAFLGAMLVGRPTTRKSGEELRTGKYK